MEYFKKISVKTVPQTIIDCPIRIHEIAIIQDTVKKDILGRIIFANQSKKNIIAVFFDLAVKDISGEPIALNESCFIYQDMIVAPGELYGNKIAINLLDNARFFSAMIHKIVFENGDVWKASDAQICPEFTLEQIDIPKENYERIRRELTKVIPDVSYINYYYQENESAWLCSCGKINALDSTTCSFCGCEKSSQATVLTKEHFSSFCDNINSIVEEEKEEATRKATEEKQRREEENVRKEKERLEQQAEEKREREIQHKARRDEIIRYCIIGAEAVIACVIIALIINTYQLSLRLTYSSAEEMQEALDGTYTYYDDYGNPERQIVIDGNYGILKFKNQNGEIKNVRYEIEWHYKRGTFKLNRTYTVLKDDTLKASDKIYYLGGETLQSSSSDTSTSSSSEDEQTDFKLSDVNVSFNSQYTVCTGKITNNGDKTCRSVRVKGSFADETGYVIDTDSTYAVGSKGLAPGETSSFKMSVEKNTKIIECYVTITAYEYD